MAEQNSDKRPAMKSYSVTETVDAVVIGTGAGGAPLLSRLAKAGLKVVALEAGNFWHPATDFATDEVAQSKLFWNDERLSAGNNPLAFGNNNSGIGVGGSTLHYTAYTPRPQNDDFNIYNEFGVGENWPIGYENLEKYFSEIEHFIGVSGPENYPWGKKRNSTYPLAPLPLNGAAQLMERGCKKLNIQTSPAPNAALSAKYYQDGVGWRNACTNRGYCQAGCTTGGKSSMDVTYIPLAIHYGAEIRDHCFVTQFEVKNNAVVAIIYNKNGVDYQQKCSHVFLCAGAIETPRLLLMNNLANSSGEVGKNFMAHTGIQIWGQFDDDIRPYKGIPGALISEDFHRPENVDFAGGYLLQSIGVMPVTYASQMARGRGLWGEAFMQAMRGYNHTAGINILGECLPYKENFVELSEEKDKRGLPKPKVHFTSMDNENKLTSHAENIMREIWKEAGATDVWAFDRNAHIIGTCRMGNDSQKSVVNKECKSWDVTNLYIADNSVFPSALSVNPALTIMAVSLYAADCFLKRNL